MVSIPRSASSTVSVTSPSTCTTATAFDSGPPASQREVGDVDVVLAQHRSDASDHSGHIEIAQVDHVALKRRFDVNAVDLQQPRLAVGLNAAGNRVLLLAALEGHAQHVGGSRPHRASACAR